MKDQTKKLGTITQQLKRTEQVLHASEETYRQMVENAGCIILRMDAHGSITFFNEFARMFFGYTGRERRLIGQEMHDGIGRLLTGLAIKGIKNGMGVT